MDADHLHRAPYPKAANQANGSGKRNPQGAVPRSGMIKKKYVVLWQHSRYLDVTNSRFFFQMTKGAPKRSAKDISEGAYLLA